MSNKNLSVGKQVEARGGLHAEIVSHKMKTQAHQHDVDFANGLAAGATAAGLILATSAAILEMPIFMAIAVAMAGIAAAAAIKKLRIIEPFLRAEEKQRNILSAKQKEDQTEHMVVR